MRILLASDRAVRRALRVSTLGLVTAVAAGLVVSLTAAGPRASAAEIRPVTPSGIWTIDGHGNGHGHGLSQYGARGAAIQGLSYDRILSFYYPGTTLSTLASTVVRVGITGSSSAVTVGYQSGLTLAWGGQSYPVPAGSTQWRLVPSATSLALQRLTGASWSTVKTGLSEAYFSAGVKPTRYYRSASTAVDYRGTVGAVRSGAGLIPINRVSLDDYVRGVAPREMPASWQAEAVKAQVVAARSYGRYAVEHNSSQPYDICDTTSCQVYGGAAQFSNGVATGMHEEATANAAVSATANQVLRYSGSTIFAQFSASNGGVTSGGGQPYFVSRVDPYDTAVSGDPYLNWTYTATAADVASYYGLTRVTQIQITGRAGGGEWGGAVTTGTVIGTGSSGQPVSVAVSGAGLASALGLPYSYFRIRPGAPFGHLDAIDRTAAHSYTVRGWTYDTANSGVSTSVRVTVDSVSRTVVANGARPDVQQVFHTVTANHGFSTPVTLADGAHRICVVALGIDTTMTMSLGCATVTVAASPLGHVDSVVKSSPGHVTITGWAFDPDLPAAPGRVAVYIDGGGRSLSTTLPRIDVQRVYNTAILTVGFALTVPVSATSHTVCVYNINAPGTPGANVAMGCYTVTG